MGRTHKLIRTWLSKNLPRSHYWITSGNISRSKYMMRETRIVMEEEININKLLLIQMTASISYLKNKIKRRQRDSINKTSLEKKGSRSCKFSRTLWTTVQEKQVRLSWLPSETCPIGSSWNVKKQVPHSRLLHLHLQHTNSETLWMEFYHLSSCSTIK